MSEHKYYPKPGWQFKWYLAIFVLGLSLYLWFDFWVTP